MREEEMSTQVNTASIELPADLYARVNAMRALAGEVTGDETSFEECLALAITRGLDMMLADIIGGADAATQLAAMQQLATRHPAEIYDFVAQALKRGESINRENADSHIGFRPHVA
jgi:hypothetical protein